MGSADPSRLRPRFLAAAAFLAAGALLLTPPSALAQQARTYTIQGVVRDSSSGEPLQGVSVQLVGTARGGLTNESGRYEFEVTTEPGTYTLRLRRIGRATVRRPVRLGGDESVRVDAVRLRQTAVELEEMVVTTGTGAAVEKQEVGNTIEVISGEEVEATPGADALDRALQGKVTGAAINATTGQAGGGTSVRLRGTSSILGSAEPLYVIDGLIVDNSSTALISVGANAGRGNVSASNRISDLVAGDIERVEVLKGAAAAALYGSRASSGVVKIFTEEGQPGLDVTLRQEFTTSATPNRYDLLQFPRAGLADVLFGPADSVGQRVERFDVQDRVFRRPVGTSTVLTVSGGSGEGTSFFLSGSYRDQPGIVESNSSEKMGGRLKVTSSLTPDLSVTGTFSYVTTDRSFLPAGEQVEGALTNVIFTPTSFDFRFDENLGRFPRSPILGPNPLAVIEQFEADQETRRLLASFQTRFRPTDRLTLRYTAGLDDGRLESRSFQPRGSFSASFSGFVANPIRMSRQFNNDFTATYEQPAAEWLTLVHSAGFRSTWDRTEVVRSSAREIPPFRDLVGGASQFASQAISQFRTVGGWLQERARIEDRLFLTGGLNVEASSAFGEEERLQYFPRASLSYVISREPFWTSDLVSSLRLRAAYGESGGQPPDPFARFQTFTNLSFAGRSGLIQSTRSGNPELEPERQEEYELGLEAGLLDDRAQLEFTYYDQTTKRLVLPVDEALSRGVETQFRNVGRVNNKGVEAALRTVNVQQGDFTWRSRLSLSHNENTVTDLRTRVDTLLFGFGGPFSNAVVEGQPVGAFYGTLTARDEDGDPVIDPDTGMPKRARNPDGSLKRTILGNPNPDLKASFRNSFDLGDRLSASVLFEGRFGNDVANLSRRIMEFFGTDAGVKKEIQRAIERKENPDLQPIQIALNGALIGNFGRYIEDGDYVKLRELALSYTFGRGVADLFGAESLSVRVAGRNVVTFTDYSGLDPEINMFGANTVAQGMDFATTPVPRQFVASASLSF